MCLSCSNVRDKAVAYIYGGYMATLPGRLFTTPQKVEISVLYRIDCIPFYRQSTLCKIQSIINWFCRDKCLWKIVFSNVCHFPLPCLIKFLKAMSQTIRLIPDPPALYCQAGQNSCLTEKGQQSRHDESHSLTHTKTCTH